MLKSDPMEGMASRAGKRVLVDDGTRPARQIKEVTAGSKTGHIARSSSWRRVSTCFGVPQAHIWRMATIVRCNCGAEYKRTEAKFLVPHTGHASCKICGATLESWLESTHVATFELIKRPDGMPT